MFNRTSLVRRRNPPRPAGWVLAGVVLATLLSSLLAAALLIALVLLTASGVDAAPGQVLAAAPLVWLAAHRVPLSIGQDPLSALPMLPTLALGWSVAACSAKAARKLPATVHAGAVSLAAGFAHACCGGLLAQVLVPPVAVHTGVAVLGCGLTSGCASAIGVACGWAGSRLDARLRAVLRVTGVALAGVVAAGGIALLAGWCAAAPRSVAGFAAAGTAGDAFGLAVLCLLYLPNALVLSWSFIAGPGYAAGPVSVQLVSDARPPDVGFPLLAALPSAHTPGLWLVVLLPVATGVLTGVACRRGQRTGADRLLCLGCAAVLVALVMLVLAALAGRELGRGPHTPVSAPALPLALVTLCWTGLPALGALWVLEGAGAAERTREAKPPPPELDPAAVADIESALRDVLADSDGRSSRVDGEG